MRISLFIIVAMLLFACGSTSTFTNKADTTDGWYVHLDTARSEASRINRPIFLLFTGSDWCAPCMQLEREVLSQKAFQSFAEDNLVLVKMDFIRKGPQPSIEMQIHRDSVANNFLGDRQSVPTVFLLNKNGSMIAKTTFRKGGADAYVRHIRQLLGNE